VSSWKEEGFVDVRFVSLQPGILEFTLRSISHWFWGGAFHSQDSRAWKSPGLSELQLWSNLACLLASLLKEINCSLSSLFLSVSQQGCLAVKAMGIMDPGIYVLELRVLSQPLRNPALSQSFRQLKSPKV
jgi:hypothetical protein